MINNITLAIPYYNAANVLPLQLEYWNAYTDNIKKNLKIVLVDDCSNDAQKLSNVFKKIPDLDIEIYEVLEDIPWNDGGAGNLSVFVTKTDWVLRTDIDYLVPTDTMEYILNTEFDPTKYYTFDAMYHHNKQKIDIHPSTLLITKKLFIDSGAYDEDFTGNHGYTDNFLRLRLDNIAKNNHLNNVYIEGILNGSTHKLIRNDTINYDLLIKKINNGLPIPTSHLRFKWKKVEI
jgi:hypothetical protein